MPGVIVPRKTVNELRKLIDETGGDVDVALSDTKIRFAFDDAVLTEAAQLGQLGRRAFSETKRRLRGDTVAAIRKTAAEEF